MADNTQSFGGHAAEAAENSKFMGAGLGMSGRILKLRGPEELFIRMTVLQFAQINEINQTFTVKIRIHSKWACPEADTQDATKRLASVDTSWEPSWKPMFSFGRSVGRDAFSAVYFSQLGDGVDAMEREAGVDIDGDDKVGEEPELDGPRRKLYIWSRHDMEVQVQDTFNFRAFPFDLQDFTLTLYCENATQLRPLQDGDFPVVTIDFDGLKMPQMDPWSRQPAIFRLTPGRSSKALLLGAAAYDDDDDDDDDPVGGRQAELRVVFFYERMSTTYFLQFYLILILIVSCVFSSWAIHFQDVAGRLGVDVTLLLVAVSFTQASHGLAPPVNYMTLLERYSVMSTLFLLLVVIVHSLIGHLTFDCDGVSGDCFPREAPLAGTSKYAFNWYEGLLDAAMPALLRSSAAAATANATAGHPAPTWDPLENSAMSDVVSRHMETMMLFDRWSLLVFIVVWLLSHIVYFGYAYRYASSLKGRVSKDVVQKLGFAPCTIVKRRYAWFETRPQRRRPSASTKAAAAYDV